MSESEPIKATSSSPDALAPLMFYVLDESGYGTYTSQPLIEFLGLEKEQDLLGIGWVDFIHEEDRQVVLEHVIAACCTRKPFTMEYRIRQDRHTYVWMLDIGMPNHTPTGEFKGYVGLLFTMPAQSLAANESRKARRVLGEPQDLPIFMHRFDGTITYWGEAAAMLYGWTADEAQGCKLDDLIYRYESARLTETREILSEQNEWSGTLTHQTKSGRSVPVQVRSAFLTDNPTAPLSTQGLVTVVCPQ